MSRRLANLTLDNLDGLGRLGTSCRSCVFWELDPATRSRDGALEKEAWVSDTLLEWGCCGQLLTVDGAPAGYALYAPPAYVPRAAGFATSPVAADAVLLTALRVAPDQVGGGLGRMLVQGVARDVVRRGVKAVEAFGHTAARQDGCLLPADFLLAVGFKTVRPHPRTPRLRLELKTLASWREDVESAFEKFLGSIHVPGLSSG